MDVNAHDDPLSRLHAVVHRLSNLKGELLAEGLEKHRAAEELWWEHRERIRNELDDLYSEIRRWFRDGLPSNSLNEARLELEATQIAINDLLLVPTNPLPAIFQPPQGPEIPTLVFTAEKKERVSNRAHNAEVHVAVLSRWRDYILPPERSSIGTPARPVTLSKGEREREGGQQGVKGKNVNGRMAEMLQSDPMRLEWSARKWAKNLNCSEGTVKETMTWKQTVKTARALNKADRMQRPKRRT